MCAERISEVLDTDSSVIPPENPIRELKDPGVVELRGAQFQFPGAEEPVLRDITFRAEPGKTTAIIGGAGSGKTTLLNLIPRLIDFHLRIGIGGRSRRPRHRHRVALLGDRSGSAEALSVLRHRRHQSSLRKPRSYRRMAVGVPRNRPSCRLRPCHAEGLDTGGARRYDGIGWSASKLAIARALVRKPQIYLFDDSFSALDLTTDARLRATLRPVTQDACIVVVAQRISTTIVEADQIIVLDDGAIVGIGTHDELVVSCPTYGEIVASQLAVQDAS